MKKLDFKTNKVETLTLEDLRQTYKENLVTGQPVGGIYHFELIARVMELFEKAGLNPHIQEIFAADNRDSKRPGVTLLPQLEEKYGERALEAHLLRRVYANIEVRADESEDMVTCLAVAYHQKGIQVGIGPMVRVCHNQTILSARDVVSTYSWQGFRQRREELTIEALMSCVKDWAQIYGDQQQGRMSTVEHLKSQAFTRDDLYKTIGVLVEKRIRHDTGNKELHNSAPYPLNSSQINETAETLISNYSSEFSFWDAFNCFNTVLKPDRMDIPQVLPQSVALAETLLQIAYFQ